MSTLSLLLPTDTQADVPGSPFFLPPLCLHSPQPSPLSPLIVQSPNADPDLFWHEAFYDANPFPSKPDLGETPPYYLDCNGNIVDQYPVSPLQHFNRTSTLANPRYWQSYDLRTPRSNERFTPNLPSISESDGGSTPSDSDIVEQYPVSPYQRFS
jgi:hypothetical protein